VLDAADGEEALRQAADHEGGIQLLITDVIMPKLGGKELSYKLEKTNPGMKTLYISGYTDNAIVNHGVLDEGLAFIQKPFQPEELIKKIRELLDLQIPE
jgi:DNA-binding NtrC family response regulator